ncbi:MAG TPA: PP2C family serine/threonine-protein phosphatase [Acidobacteriaceae bacterium]|jgi:protein phosphatase|nr:PP2C family serine/threonine-protein phosphatase [Acidobacteriaceae bacterium]
MADAATVKPPKQRPVTAKAVNVMACAAIRTFAMLSDRGLVRHSNQDSCAALPELGAFVVCDGMGGAAGGEVASQLATEAFLNYLAHPSCPPVDPAAAKAVLPRVSREPINVAQPGAAKQARVRLAEAIQVANHAVFRHSCVVPSLHGMGTTLVALLWEESPPSSTLWIGHVGDSRCYRLRSGTLQLLTEDHSLVEEEVRAGLLTRVQAAASPMRNIITRAIGTQPTVEPEITACATQPGDLYLLASDGLSRELDESTIKRVITRSASLAAPASTNRNSVEPGFAVQSALDTACQALVDAANSNGGHDNITVLLAACA